MQLTDTHCHLDFPAFEKDLDVVLNTCMEKNVHRFVLPGVVEKGWDAMLRICKKYPQCFAAPGLHPCFTSRHTRTDLDRLEALLNAQKKKIIAVGETGLDHYIPNPAEKIQQEYFEAQVALAKQGGYPLLLHVRKAHDPVAKHLKKQQFDQRGIVHCYSGSLQQAKRYLNLGFKLGVGGVITYDGAKRLQKVVQSLPLEAFVLETDAPDLPIQGKTKQRNSPAFIPDIFQAFCRYRPEPQEEVEHALRENTQQVFHRMS